MIDGALLAHNPQEKSQEPSVNVSPFIFFPGQAPRRARPVPLAARLHHQDDPAGAPQAHAAQGQHEALAAARGVHLLNKHKQG